MKQALYFSMFLLFAVSACSPKGAAPSGTNPQKAETAMQPKPGGEPKVEAPPTVETDMDTKVSDSNDPKNGQPSMVPRFELMSISRTACFGKCPVYTAKLYSDGYVEYEGKKFVENEGKFSGTINLQLVSEIVNQANKANFFALDDFYPERDKMIKDIPNTITTFTKGGKTKKVTNNHNAPNELIELEQLLDKLFDGVKWEPMK